VIPAIPWLDRLAHDLRGPLTPLQTAAYLLRTGQVDAARQQELFVLIERQTQLLVRMIEELSDWTRISQDRLLGRREPCEPAVLLDYARTGSGAAGTAALVENHAGSAMVQGDPVRLTQLLRTLIEHASAHGNAAATVRLQPLGNRLRIDVIAAGPAPDPAQIASTLEDPQAEPYDGSLGLRLLIARAVAEAHGGSLVALAEDGHLVLRCELPIAPR
jgi:K+-sensing histidine kinase KdpD